VDDRAPGHARFIPRVIRHGFIILRIRVFIFIRLRLHERLCPFLRL